MVIFLYLLVVEGFEVEAFDEVKHLEEKHVTWAQYRKKRDKNAALHDFDQAMVLNRHEEALGRFGELTTSGFLSNHRLGCHVDSGLDQPTAELREYLHITLTRVTSDKVRKNVGGIRGSEVSGFPSLPLIDAFEVEGFEVEGFEVERFEVEATFRVEEAFGFEASFVFEAA
ncbi:hypothetical protein Tco_1332098 [Tanacetum coccineum]